METSDQPGVHDQPRDLRGQHQVRRKQGLLAGITPQHRLYWLRLLLQKPAAVLSIGFIAIMLVATFVWPTLSPHDPLRLDPVARLSEPSSEYWFGTDGQGRDVLVRAIYGARTSLLVGVTVMLLSTFLGSAVGLIAGYYQRIDTPIMRIMDGIMAFPSILLAIAIMATLGPATQNVIVALGVVYMPIVSRLVRGQTLSIKNQSYVEAARSVGANDFSILSKHIFMNALSPLIVQCTFIVAYSIIAEASLSFLGAGVPPEVPTWGAMLRDGKEVLNAAWWPAMIPGALLFLTVLAMNLIGDGLRDALDPQSRSR